MKNSNTNYGIGSCELLTIVFIMLKLNGVIDWSWLWVLSPLWITTVLSVILILIVLFYTRGS